MISNLGTPTALRLKKYHLAMVEIPPIKMVMNWGWCNWVCHVKFIELKLNHIIAPVGSVAVFCGRWILERLP